MSEYHDRRGLVKKSGFVLILVVALLGVLGFLAIDLAFQSRQSRVLSLNTVGLAKATLAARSGIEKGLQGTVAYARRPVAGLLFSQQLMSAGEDVNRNGLLDPGEDLDGDGRLSIQSFLDDRAPSLALADATGGVSLLVDDGEHTRGITWRNAVTAPEQLCTLRISVPSIDLNAGVMAGEGQAGQDFMTNHTVMYSASSLTHPFNIPLRRFLNAWGNHHKYLAMVRPDKTYNFDRSSDMGLIDSPENLMDTAANARNPIFSFDVFNPSGNHALDSLGNPVFSEPPLGDLILAARPGGGYRRVADVLSLVEAYVTSWVDMANRRADGNGSTWMHADGTPIPVMTPGRIKAIVDEFRDLAVTNPRRERGWVFNLGTPSPSPPNEMDGLALNTGYFELHQNRHYLFTKVYDVPSLRVDINRAPLSVLAALVHAPGQVALKAYDPYLKVMTALSDPIPFQSENNHPCYWAYSGADREHIAGKPLFSMTESLRLAQDMVGLRQVTLFQNSTCGLRDFLRAWNKGYDAKFHELYTPDHQFNAQVWSLPATQFSNVSQFYDLYHSHRRVQILAELLNPHPNDARVVWDEALPLAVENRRQRLAITGHPFKGLYFMLDEAEGTGAEKCPEVSFQTPEYRYTSLGWSPYLGQRRILTTVVRLYEKVELGTQADFVETARDVPPSMLPTLGSWVTYPELLGVSPCTWTGHLALKPVTRTPPWGESVCYRVPLNGYNPAPTTPVNGAGSPVDAWPTGGRMQLGPNEADARGKLLNSLQPSPTGMIRSLYPSTAGLIDVATDLLPGGGIRMSPYNNSKIRAVNTATGLAGWPNHKEALLVLRNSKTNIAMDNSLPDSTEGFDPGSTISPFLPSIREGAVSFYVKPRFHCQSSQPSGACTLFYWPFSVYDQETQSRCTGLSYPGNEPFIRSQFVGSMRLVWWSYPGWVGGTQFDMKPMANWRWPAVIPFAGFAGQIDAGPFYFSNMGGRTDPGNATSRGHLFPEVSPIFGTNAILGGDGIEGHWPVPNPPSNEVLVLEWELHKFAFHNDQTSPVGSNPGTQVTPTWASWDTTDQLPMLAQRCWYTNPTGSPHFLFDTSDPILPPNARRDYHSVRKCFYLERPLRWVGGAEDGRGPRDSHGDLQALIETGRWNHIFIAWRNLDNVLDNAPPNKGGCLAAYVNGSYSKTSNLDFATTAILFNMDYSPAYRGSSVQGLNFSSWPTGREHNPYQTMTYQGPLADTGILGSHRNYGKTYCIPRSHDFTNYSLPPSPSRLDGNVIGNQGVNPLNPCGINYANTFYNHFYSPRKSYLFRRFPSRFYFGFEPHTISNYVFGTSNMAYSYFASNITWGSFMDVYVFTKPTTLGPDSPLGGDGGFLPELPNYNAGGANVFSPYPSYNLANTLKLYPLLQAPSQALIEQGINLVGFSWAAHLPPFHEFWDDQEPDPGVDMADAQAIQLDHVFQTVPNGLVGISQDPGTVSTYSWESATPLAVTSVADIHFILGFKGPAVVLSTPLVENVDLVFLRKHPLFFDYNLE
ncbi:MAG: hypothetical protein AB7F75_01790 [Planctomycetota bacterium]